MIQPEDILRLAYTPDLSTAGISRACLSLAHGYAGVDRAAYDRLRHLVAEVAVELAFRRHLVERSIPFSVRGPTDLSEPDHYGVVLRRRRLEIQTFLIKDRDQAGALEEDPGLLLEVPALVGLEQYAADGLAAEDVYVFAFVPAITPDPTRPVKTSIPSAQISHLVHLMPGDWARPRVWMPLGPLVLKSESEGMLEIEIGGQDGNRGPLNCRATLPARKRLELAADFHALTYIHSETAPRGRLGIRSPTRRETQVVQAAEWHDIWLEADTILIAGWITRDQFRQRAKLIQEGRRVFQYRRTRKKNLAMPISDLRPLARLLEVSGG